MTLQEVQQAQAELQARGVPVSANTILARIGGSKRDILKHLRVLRGSQAPATPPGSCAAPEPPLGADAGVILSADDTALASLRSEVVPQVYGRLPTVRVCDPDKPGDYIVINASDWGEGQRYPPQQYPLFEDLT